MWQLLENKKGCVLCGQELDDLLFAGIEYNMNGLIGHLSQFDGRDLFQKWLKLVRCIDEFVNMKYVLLHEEWKLLEDCRIDIIHDTKKFSLLLKMLYNRFGEHVSERMKLLIMMLSSIRLAYQNNGLQGMTFISNIAEAVAFCQSKRLYYVTYLSLIRIYAKGTQRVAFLDLLNHFQYQIDFNMSSITSALHSIIGNRCIDGYKAIVRDFGLEYYGIPYDQLEGFFLEPQVMNELDILLYQKPQLKEFATLREQQKPFSYAELEYAIAQAEKVFDDYGIKDNLVFIEAKRMVEDIRGKFYEDYSITFTHDDFKAFCSCYPHLKLCSKSNNYFEAINERPAFFQYENCYYSTVLLLIRFIENCIYEQLRRNRRFRIKAGFVFEKKVTAMLEQHGFESMKTKRIHNQEFDVICMKDGCAYNFQCKNNFLDINSISPDNIDKVSRQNKRLVRYYIKALEKENLRTKLVQDHFNVEQVENYVVTRFPVVMNHKRLIPFNQLERWLKENL